MKKNIHLILLLLLYQCIGAVAQQKSVARRWNEAMLEAIREDLARPPVQARNLYHVSMAMWDAWAAYDTLTADTYILGKTVNNFGCQFDGVPKPANIEAAREKAISYAAFRMLTRRFQNSPNASASITRFRNLMTDLGYDWTFNSNFYQSGDPAALGNYIADCVSFLGLGDGANETGNYNYINYAPVNPPLDPTIPGAQNILDPNRWQPLELEGAIDQQGNPIPALQRFQSPEWGKVYPFALPDSAKNVYQRNGLNWNVYYDPGPLPMLDTADGLSDEYKWNFNLVSIWSSHITPDDGVMWDISPASIGDTPWLPETFDDYKNFYQLDGRCPSNGRPINPKTGLPYQPQIVPRGDYARVLAHFWADGPNSETPPGHWFSIFNKVMDHPQFVRKFNGTGPELPALEYDVKAYFTLGAALHDAAIAAWSIKGWYDGVRPISALRYMAGRGQSSNTLLPQFNISGIKLEPGYIELIQPDDPLAGPNGENVNKIKLLAWKGFSYINNPATDYASVGWILADNWWPYQRRTFVTPPFAGYVSGHSTYSRAAAEALTLLTGDEYFPGGLEEYHVPANSGLWGIEKGPIVDITLQWATYRDAADQTSLSRIWGGIHPPIDDIPGRKIGARCGIGAFWKAKSLFYNNDADADGFDYTVDCDDHNASIYPGAPEICDGFDNNCNSQTDEGLQLYTYYADQDGDGYGDGDSPLVTCQDAAPQGYVTNTLDCIDLDATIYPGAPEICDGFDNDCNGEIDEGLTFSLYYEDEDGDGFGTPQSKFASCSPDPPGGFVTNGLDCDDKNPDINPLAAEVCDGIDNNCNGLVDDELPTYSYYLDQDGDGFGILDSVLVTCLTSAPVGMSLLTGDCDDANPTAYPGAPEILDGLDNDCNGLIDDFISAKEPEPALEIRVYPNPVRDRMVLMSAQLDGEAEVWIVNSANQVTKSMSVVFAIGQSVLQLADLPQGVYTLRISDTKGMRFGVQRVVKM